VGKNEGIGLSETLRQLRRELADAQAKGDGERLRFEVTEAEVELAVQVTKEGGPEGKVKINVIGAGVGLGTRGRFSRESTHRLSLKLAVKDATTGRTAEISDPTRRAWR